VQRYEFYYPFQRPIKSRSERKTEVVCVRQSIGMFRQRNYGCISLTSDMRNA